MAAAIRALATPLPLFARLVGALEKVEDLAIHCQDLVLALRRPANVGEQVLYV